MVGSIWEFAGSFGVEATRTGEQQEERKERHSKNKQWYSGFERFPPPPHPNGQERGGGVTL